MPDLRALEALDWTPKCDEGGCELAAQWLDVKPCAHHRMTCAEHHEWALDKLLSLGFLLCGECHAEFTSMESRPL